MKLPRQFVHLDCLERHRAEHGALPIGPGNRRVHESWFGDKAIPTCAVCGEDLGFEPEPPSWPTGPDGSPLRVTVEEARAILRGITPEPWPRLWAQPRPCPDCGALDCTLTHLPESLVRA